MRPHPQPFFQMLAVGALLAGTALTARAQFGVLFSYDGYARVLSPYVDAEGMVDYGGLQKEREGLDAFLKDVAGLYTDTYADWSVPEKIAFWINTYNALTLKSIIDRYPIKPSWTTRFIYPNGIRQIPGVWTEATHTVMGQEMTLDHIEHEVLRKEFNEPRIHMALVCAARGCPPLRNEPFLAESLDKQLTDQSKRFLKNPGKFRVDPEARRVYLSSIFKWFGADFLRAYGEGETVPWGTAQEKAVLRFVGPHLDPATWDDLKANDYSVEYLDYDWSLNEQK